MQATAESTLLLLLLPASSSCVHREEQWMTCSPVTLKSINEG